MRFRLIENVNQAVPHATLDVLENGLYEATAVLAAPEHIHDFVLEMRWRAWFLKPLARQTLPHLTLLYFGLVNRPTLINLYEGCDNIPFEGLELELTGFDVLKGNGRVTNFHLEVSPAPALRQLHKDVLEVAKRLSITPAYKWVGDLYRPHITVWTNLNESPEAMSAFDRISPPTSGRFDALELRAHRRTPPRPPSAR